jgi:hypothetical protein
MFTFIPVLYDLCYLENFGFIINTVSTFVARVTPNNLKHALHELSSLSTKYR